MIIRWKGREVDTLELSNSYGVPEDVIKWRKDNFLGDDDIIEPLDRVYTVIDGKLLTIADISKLTTISWNTINRRYHAGYRGKDLLTTTTLPLSPNPRGKKIDAELAKSIFMDSWTSGMTQPEIADKYKISVRTVLSIKAGQTWGNITDSIRTSLNIEEPRHNPRLYRRGKRYLET